MSKRVLFTVFAVFVIAATILSACAPAATPTPEAVPPTDVPPQPTAVPPTPEPTAIPLGSPENP
jgi:hypothetical protein